MRRIALLMLTAGWLLSGLAGHVAAQDQLVRPSGVSLGAGSQPRPTEPREPLPPSDPTQTDQTQTASGAGASGAGASGAGASGAGASGAGASGAGDGLGDGADAGTDSLAIPLKRQSDSERRSGAAGLFGGPLATITGGLAVTLGLFAVIVAVARRGGGTNLRGLPREAFEVIGQTSIGPRQRLLVVRVGTQAVVIGTSPAGIQPVAQIDDPDEAGQLIAQCRGIGAQAAFKSTLRELEQEPTAAGFVDQPAAKPGRLFLRG